MPTEEKISYEYERRRPEFTLLYKIVSENLSTFIQNRREEGRPLPEYVEEEFEAFLRCGVAAFGFIRLKCPDCGEEMIVAFSCKKRGFCPSCAAKRKAESATHLVENVLPHLPYRQFVVSFPVPLRYWLQTNKKLYSKIHSLVIKQIHRYYEDKAKALGIKDPRAGSISFSQRWGSACNLNPHMHVLCPDGVYSLVNEKARFRNASAISDNEVGDLISSISQSVMKYLMKKGYLDKDGEVVLNPLADDLFSENESLSLATSCSISGKIAFGPNAGKYVRRIGAGFGYEGEIPLIKSPRCYSVNGFSLHANTHINTHRRDRLKELIEYIARGPLSNERLEITDKGEVKLRLKTRYSDGTTHLLFSPEEFLEKLSALIPPPRTHLVRWGGVFAPASPLRKRIVLKPEVKKGFQFAEIGEGGKKKNRSWSKMLSKVFGVDVLKCPKCSGELKPMAAITDPHEIKRYLEHVGLDYDPPVRSPPKSIQQSFDFELPAENEEDVIYID